MTENNRIFLCWETIHAYFRITTSTKIYGEPLNFAESKEKLKPLWESERLTLLSPTLESFDILSNYASMISLKGTLLTDAVIASQLEANGIKTIYTNNADFKKFSYLKVKNPLL